MTARQNAPKRTHGPGLRFARESRGWTLEALAKAVGSSKSHLCQVERGDKDASPGLLLRLTEALNVPSGLLTSANFPRPELSRNDAA